MTTLTLLVTVGLDALVHVEKRHTVLRPLKLVFAVEVGVKGLGEDIKVNVVVLEHVEDAEAAHCSHTTIRCEGFK